MANNYCESSSMLGLPSDKYEEAEVIIDRIIEELESDEEENGYVGCDVSLESEGVWFRHEESINVDHVERFAKALIEELEIDEPFYCSWSYACDKPHIDEFGGGAMVIQRGKETYWVDAMSHARSYVKEQNAKEQNEK